MVNSLDEEVCTIKLEANTVFAISQPAGCLNFRVDQFKICVNDFVGCKPETFGKYVYFMQTIVLYTSLNPVYRNLRRNGSLQILIYGTHYLSLSVQR